MSRAARPCCWRRPRSWRAAATRARPTRSRSARWSPSWAGPTAAKDYQALCDRILAPSLVEDVKQIGLPCEVALQQGLADVKDPKITIGKITVTEDKATAEIRTVATGQAPSRDTLALVRIEESWRVSSLGG